jgi:hypothetical protein
VIGLLPWEKWLPAWVLGPVLCVGSVVLLVLGGEHAWWQYILFSIAAIVGAAQFLVWVRTGRNILQDDLPPSSMRQRPPE